MNKKIFNIKNLDILYTVIYTLLLYIILYFIKYDNISRSLRAFKYISVTGNLQYIIVGYLIILALFFIIRSIVNDNLKTNIIITVITLTITIISYYKTKILSTPFVPSDILLIGNINQIAGFGISIPSFVLLLGSLILIILLILQYIIKIKYYRNLEHKKTNICFRILFFIIGIITLYNICISPNRFIKLNIKNDLGDDYTYLGGNAVFFMHLGDFYSVAPDKYNKENVEEIKQEVESTDYIVSKQNDIKPNVIMIMNESFSNPNKLKNIEYSVNPIVNIENLSKNDSNCKIGSVVTPVFGGGTSLPEFEALTGLSSYFLEKQIFPYTSYIRSDINSIVREYKNNGYTTVGIHTNTGNFYNRKNVYKYLGFEQTVFSENIEEAEIKGGNISDNELANQIINKFQENDGNKFIFGVTMQNHMKYTTKQYEEYDVEIESSNLSEVEKSELRNYIQGVYDGDQMYLKLVNYLKEINEPTILVMFGDHLPSFSTFNPYKNFSKIDCYLTPYVIWSNYDVEYNDIPEFISPSYLSINILKLSNLELPWYLKKFEELYKIYPGINNVNVITNNKEILEPDIIKEYDLVKDCEILEYDLLIKKKYINIK